MVKMNSISQFCSLKLLHALQGCLVSLCKTMTNHCTKLYRFKTMDYRIRGTFKKHIEVEKKTKIKYGQRQILIRHK